jgi:hypothetical protein
MPQDDLEGISLSLPGLAPTFNGAARVFNGIRSECQPSKTRFWEHPVVGAKPAMNFTAAQIAQALGCSAQAVRQRLAAVQPTATRIIRGKESAAWHLAALPMDLRNELAALAQERGFGKDLQAVEAMFNAGSAWQPRFPLNQVSQAKLDKAAKLRAVLEPFLRAEGLDARSTAEIEAAGVAAYQKEFGRPIGGRWFRERLARTIEHDGGRGDWMNLSLYLDDSASAAPAPAAAKPDRADHAAHEAALGDTIRTFDDPANPTADDRKFLFDASFRHLEAARLAAPATAPAFKRTLIDFLFVAVPALSPNRAALKVVFNYKLRAWTEAGGLADALCDRRAIASGNSLESRFQADHEKIRNAAILHGGNISLAYRKLRQANELSPSFVNHYGFNPRRYKSYVPHAVRDAISAEVEMCGPIHRGPHEARMRGPYIGRDWSKVNPCDWLTADDTTLNNYFFSRDSFGCLTLHRGECLFLSDTRTDFVIGFLLIAGHYNSRHVIKLLLRGHDKSGLPHEGYYLENSIFAARAVDSIMRQECCRTESELAQYKVQIKHTRPANPRSKPIEGLIRILQERQRVAPGFVGFNERSQKMERMQKYLARERARIRTEERDNGRAAAPADLLSMEQWASWIGADCNEFNVDPQNGKRLAGLSPSEGWQEALGINPPRQLPENARYIFATNPRQVRVRQEGIVLKIGPERKLFCNEQTGRLIGQQVLAWPDVEREDLLTVTDLNSQNPFTVKAISAPAMSATDEQFAAANSQIAAHTRHAREIYGDIKHGRTLTITRDLDPESATAALGDFHNAETARFKTEQAAESRTLRKIQTASAGRVDTSRVRNPERVLRGLETVNEELARLKAEETDASA